MHAFYITLANLAGNILDGSCPNGGTAEDGWHTYIIETHCVAWRITAKKLNGHWVVRNVTSEAC